MIGKPHAIEVMASAYYEVTRGAWKYCPIHAKKIRLENMEFACDALLLEMGLTFQELQEIIHRGKDDGK